MRLSVFVLGTLCLPDLVGATLQAPQLQATTQVPIQQVRVQVGLWVVVRAARGVEMGIYTGVGFFFSRGGVQGESNGLGLPNWDPLCPISVSING